MSSADPFHTSELFRSVNERLRELEGTSARRAEFAHERGDGRSAKALHRRTNEELSLVRDHPWM
jgi:hypothetical protein